MQATGLINFYTLQVNGAVSSFAGGGACMGRHTIHPSNESKKSGFAKMGRGKSYYGRAEQAETNSLVLQPDLETYETKGFG
jgi:hypothetical protein